MRIARLEMPFGGEALRVTASIGVADLASCGDTGNAASLLALADRRLYAAKLAGRDRVASK